MRHGRLISGILFLVLAFQANAECIHEAYLTYNQAIELKSQNKDVFVEDESNSFSKLDQKYEGKRLIQWSDKVALNESVENYDDRYLTYYTPARMDQYIRDVTPLLKSKGYEVKVIGKSIQNRPLYAIYPNEFRPNAKKVLMFGRHHGDEGTANWIIEGFLNRVLSPNNDWLQNFDLVLYPMVNPDGAAAKTRYNKNGRDLNRVWATSSRSSSDEIRTIHSHLDGLIPNTRDITIALDMHGSFTEDFLFRVERSFAGAAFFFKQQEFIDQLGNLDPWQGGNFRTSNGHPKMARIRLVRDFGVNALTHETIRNVSRSSGRTIDNLKEQGEAIVTSTRLLYGN